MGFRAKSPDDWGRMFKGVSGFDVCLFILKNIRIYCKLEIQVSMANMVDHMVQNSTK